MLATPTQTKSLVDLFHQGRKRHYEKGEFIIRPGETPPGIFLIEEGLVKAYDITKYGEENLLIIRKSGEVIALTTAITGQERDVIYSAMEPTAVWLITRRKFLNHIQAHPEITLPLLDMVTNMYRLHSERILNLEYRSVRERLISFLLNTSERFGDVGKDGSVLINVPLRQQDIASSINATRETTGRQLAYLERHGYIIKQQSLLKLCNIAELKSFL
jgi:CRP/FNR family cyclic AMP-dependent transcriptional regulator